MMDVGKSFFGELEAVLETDEGLEERIQSLVAFGRLQLFNLVELFARSERRQVQALLLREQANDVEERQHILVVGSHVKQ